ncbi:MAG: NAD-dependent epimerase/dehydratase family protein [Pseudolabrys sp.]
MSRHVVVTGAGGFAGGAIAARLSELGFNVTAMSRRPPDADRNDAGLAWRTADLRAQDSLPPRFDALIHCAAEIPGRLPDPEPLYNSNIDMARSVFDQALAAGARTVAFMSSMSVYGTIDVPVVTEETPSNAPDAYGRAKRDAETMLEEIVGQGLPSGLSIRLPGTVGKGSHHNFLSDALGRVLSGDVVRANNPDAMFNNIVHVGDLADFLARWIDAPRPGYAVTNLAAPEPIAIREVVSLLFRTAGRPERIEESVGGKKPFLIGLDRPTALGYRPKTTRASIEAFVRDNLTL